MIDGEDDRLKKKYIEIHIERQIEKIYNELIDY